MEKEKRLLNTKARSYAHRLYRQVVCKADKKKMDDMPRVAVACAVPGCERHPFYAHNEMASREDYLDALAKPLEVIGPIGRKPADGSCEYRVGNCAEPHAANLLLKKHSDCQIDNISFSLAYRTRTRTLDVKDYCNNCLRTFPQLKDE